MSNGVDRQEYLRQRQEYIRRVLDEGHTPESMLAMSLASDAQELIARGMLREASELLNDIKYIIQLSLGERDEHGRHEITGIRFKD